MHRRNPAFLHGEVMSQMATSRRARPLVVGISGSTSLMMLVCSVHFTPLAARTISSTSGLSRVVIRYCRNAQKQLILTKV